MWENIQLNRLIRHKLPKTDEHIVAILTGARQTGKTTLLRSVYPELPYYNLDAIEFREQLRNISSFSWGRDVGNVLIDEVQKEPTLMDKIKFAFDAGDIRFTALSGSAQILLMKQTKETLAGRMMLLELFPLMLCELVHATEPVIPEPLIEKLLNSENINELMEGIPSVLLGEKWETRFLSEEYLLKWGGMPALIHIPDAEKKSIWLRNYSTAYLERDLTDLARLNDLMPFKTFQKLAALRSSGLLSYSELARDAGIGIETTRRYLEYLRLSYQTFLLPPYHKNLTSRLVKTPRIYWTDTGLLRHLAGYGFDLLNGQIFENYIAAEIMKYLRSVGSDADLSFYRTSSGMEVDFCIETRGKLIGIEVKLRDTVNKTDYSSLKRLKEAAGKNWKCGLVVYRGNLLRKLDESIWALPSCRLFS